LVIISHFKRLNSGDKPVILGLTASPVLAINKTITFEKIKESFENLYQKKNFSTQWNSFFLGRRILILNFWIWNNQFKN